MSDRDRLLNAVLDASREWGKKNGRDVKHIISTVSVMVSDPMAERDECLAWHLEKQWDKGPDMIVISSNRQPNGWWCLDVIRLDRVLECDVTAIFIATLSAFDSGLMGWEWEAGLQTLGFRFLPFTETPGDYACDD